VPRHNRRRPELDLRPLPGGGPERREEWRGLPYAVRAVAAGWKTYRCPGCDQEIRSGTGHVVAWPTDDPDDRRHWHSPCWAARDRRGPVVRPSSARSRPAPRY
jgi:hypothetical protein